ncbi:MAG: hypothetical protein JNK45_26185 [Myxococcales bacterium]|nr:hypothetical protein [Myxococcales bacterium]
MSDAIMGVVGARIVGTWINSESDAADLRRDWRATHDDFKARFELDYDVKRGGPSEDD